MDAQLGIAGLLSVLLSIGHATLGLRRVLPGLSEERLHGTPFGSPSMTLSMIRVTWHIVTIFALSAGGILLTLAFADADPKTVLLRWFAAMWIAATAMAFWVAKPDLRNPRRILRLPVPLVWVVVAVLCWMAST